ncbi:MAG: DNA polymerase/3'-5' exonuclease PolX [Bacteroidota bacterium]
MDKAAVSAILNEIGLLLELMGENPFKARAYYQAARAVDGLEGSLEGLVREGRIDQVPGLGPALREKVSTLVTTGRLPYYENLRAQVPPGLLTLLRVPGLGPRKVQILYRQLGLTDLNALEDACRRHLLQNLPGFGAKTEQKILAGLEWLARSRGLHLWIEAWSDAEELRGALAALAEVEAAAIAGSLRRRKEVVKDIDLVAATEKPFQVAEAFAELPPIDRVNAKGGTRVAVTLKSGIDLDLRLVAPREFASALLHLTGSREHNTALRALAKDRGLRLNEYGLFRGEERLDLASEEEIYRALGLDYIPPELREDLGEVEAAAGRALPALVEADQVRGALHVHTSDSDGTATLAEMAAAAARLGWEYMGLGDHSQSAAYAGGLKPEELRRQWAAIDAHNLAGGRPYLLKGIEAEIRPDGSLDYPDEILAGFDYVVASVHAGFNLDREAMTGRVVRAMRNQHVTVLGHPTGRLLLQREGYAIDLEAVLAAAAEYDVALEINASPYRLDLDWRWVRKACDRGIVFWVNPDAHSTGELRNVPLGINVARKGWLAAAQVGNTWSLADVRERWRRKKEKV